MQVNAMPKFSKRGWLIVAIAFLTIILLTLFSASSGSPTSRGSSYSSAPDGYGAWYAFMEKRGANIQRWQRPIQDLSKRISDNSITLLQVLSRGTPKEIAIAPEDRTWVAQGNRLVILGIDTPATEANFSKSLQSKDGLVAIDTTRRFSHSAKLLGDEFGAVVISQRVGDGEIILAATPHIAANAYQDAIGNYEFLAQLVTQDGNRVIVDEYAHGYKDRDVIVEEGIEDWSAYLAKTPLLPAMLQLAVLLVVLVVAQNRRFGWPVRPKSRTVDNSAAYMQAMAAVLHKAQSSEFVLEVVGKAEQLRIQQALGLGGQQLLDRKTIVTAWIQQTKRPATEMLSVLQVSDGKHPKGHRPRKISESELKLWLTNLQTIRQYLP
jgi:Domain of unknown function (DUF4350)